MKCALTCDCRSCKPTFYRFARVNPDRVAEWPIHAMPLHDDGSIAERGFNLATQPMSVDVLTPDELADLRRLAKKSNRQMTPDEADRFNGILERLPRHGVPGYDIDGDDQETVDALADLVVAAERERGITLRKSLSSGGKKPGVHLEFGPAHPEAAHPELMQRMLGRMAKVVSEGGAVPHQSSTYSRNGHALSWVLPRDENSDDPGAKIDLVPMNHYARSRGRMFRPAGGLYKDGVHRKTVVENPNPSPITVAMTLEVPYDPEAIGRERSKKIRANARKAEKRNALDPFVARKELEPLIKFLAKLYRKGFNHQERLALAAVFQSKSILNRFDFIAAVGAAWKDKADARAAWDSTLTRRRQNQPTCGAPWLRQRIGAVAWHELAYVLAVVTNRSFSEVLRRLGVEKVDHGNATTLIKTFADETMKKRVTNSRSCCSYINESRCTVCDKMTCRCKITCDVRELCGVCLSTWIRKTEESLVANWKSDVFIAIKHGFESKEAAAKMLRTFMGRMGGAGLRIVTPRADGTWTLMTLSEPRRGTAAAMRGMHAEFAKMMAPKHAARIAAWQMSYRGTTVMHHVERGDVQKAEDLMIALYRTSSITGRPSSSIWWPTDEDIKQRIKELMQERMNELDPGEWCVECPVGTRERHNVIHAATGQIIGDSEHPLAVGDAIKRHEYEFRLGRIAEPPGAAPPWYRARPVVNLRL